MEWRCFVRNTVPEVERDCSLFIFRNRAARLEVSMALYLSTSWWWSYQLHTNIFRSSSKRYWHVSYLAETSYSAGKRSQMSSSNRWNVTLPQIKCINSDWLLQYASSTISSRTANLLDVFQSLQWTFKLQILARWPKLNGLKDWSNLSSSGRTSIVGLHSINAFFCTDSPKSQNT
jgi:hypothetical protein